MPLRLTCPAPDFDSTKIAKISVNSKQNRTRLTADTVVINTNYSYIMKQKDA